MKINRYTETIIKPRAVAQMTNPNAIQEAAAPAFAVSDISGAVSEQIAAEYQKKQTRYDTIQRARAVSAFQNEINDDFVKFKSENDLTDPNSVKNFNDIVRKKAASYLGMHDGSQDSRASLEVQLVGLSDQYTMRASEASNAAQKQLITTQIGDHINRITNEVYNNPASIDIGFKQLNGLMTEYGGAIDSVDEMELLSNAQSMIFEGALNSFIDTGDYEAAQKLALENDAFVQKMPAKQQMSLLGRINQGIAAQDRENAEIARKMRTYKNAAREAGIEISPMQLFTASTGIDQAQTPEQKIGEFARVANLKPEQITPSIVAKVGFGVDLPGAGDIDMNKERLPDGGYTPKGIGTVIKPAYENAANTKILVDKVLLQSDEFLNSENAQAGLAAMVAFQKLIDDGAAVREGDIKLSAQGNSAFDNLQLTISRIEKGAIATPRQVQEMRRSAEVFGKAVLEASKTYIDPYLDESTKRGYRMIDIGLPQDAYNRVFKDIKPAEDTNKRNREIEEKAKSYGLSVRDYLQKGVDASNGQKTIEQVAKDLNYTGSLQ